MISARKIVLKKLSKSEKIPHHIDFEWKGKVYQHRVWVEYLPTVGDVICSWGPSEYGMDIQLFRWFGIKTMKRLLELIECGFKNQEIDRIRGKQVFDKDKGWIKEATIESAHIPNSQSEQNTSSHKDNQTSRQ